jgi:hypothetical protein
VTADQDDGAFGRPHGRGLAQGCFEIGHSGAGHANGSTGGSAGRARQASRGAEESNGTEWERILRSFAFLGRGAKSGGVGKSDEAQHGPETMRSEK